MRFDLSEGPKGEWFKFFRSEIKENGETVYLDPEEGAGRVSIRIADSETIESIQAQTRKKTAEFALNPKSRQMERVVYFDQSATQEKKERELIWDHAIVDWADILDTAGNQIPCNIENKLKLMNNPQFARFVGRCLQMISGANSEAVEAAGKNSSAG
jgi:hypothetical protein